MTPLPLSGRRALALFVSWSFVLLALLTLRTGAPFTLLEPLSVEQAAVVVLYVATSVFWAPHGRRQGIVHAHLLVVLAVLLLHPLTSTFGRDGASVVTALHAGLVVAWLTTWRPERKLLFLGLVVGFALVETILSSFREGPGPPPPGLLDYGDLMGPYGEGGFLLPGLNRQVVGPRGPVEWVTNLRGFRNREETPYAKVPGRRRLVFVGDSFVTGYRTGQEQTVGRVLERRLREGRGASGVEVLVAGAGHPFAAREWLTQNGLRFEPDLVILGLTLGNDPCQNWLARRGFDVPLLADIYLRKEAQPREFFGLFPVKLDRTLRSWRFYRRGRRLFTPEVISSWYRDFPTAVHLFDPGHSLGLFYSRQGLPVVEQALGDLLSELADLQAQCAARRMPLLVVVIPQRFQMTDREWRATLFEYGLDPQAFELERPNRRLLEGCAARGLACVDLLPGFRAEGERMLYQPQGDMHWNDAGHALAAGLVAGEIARRFPQAASDPR